MSEKQKRLRLNLNLKRTLITSMIVVALVPAIIVGVASFINASHKVSEQIEHSATNSVNLLNQNISQTIDLEKERLDYLASHISAVSIKNGENRETINTLLSQQQADSGLAQAYVGTKKGHYVYTPQSLIKPDGFDPVTRPWFIDAMKQPHHVVVNEPYNSVLVKDYVVSLSSTTTDTQGVVGIDLNLGELQKIANSVRVGESGYAFIVSPGGKIVAHPKLKPGTKVPDAALLKKIKKSSSGSVETNYKGIEKKDFYVTNKDTGWVIVGSLNNSDISRNTNGILMNSILIGAITAIIAAAFALMTVYFIIRPIKNLLHVANKVTEKDLTNLAEKEGFDEFKQLGTGFNQMISSLNNVLIQVDDKATAVASSSEELTASTEENRATSDEVAQAIQEIAAGSQEQNQKVEASKQSVARINKETEKIATQATVLSERSVDATDSVNNGKHALTQVVQQIKIIRTTNDQFAKELNDLEGKLNQISDTNNLINDIAAQTHLLSLNAAIEAARAGEHGKGFSVVAAEIQKLAVQSAESTAKIADAEASITEKVQELVQSMKTGAQQVSKGIGMADTATTTFADVEETVASVSKAAREMSDSVQKISGSSGEIVERIDAIAHLSETTSGLSENVSAAAEQQSASMEEIAHNATNLSILADELRQVVAQFVINKA
ncbi:methyl-accepting chemotaxis protein [Sporolactobacillus terrae]|uniref:Methyl-accepting chemotaxis protein n=1 Tax=Sporolactobacillus terrae TaxID=269673 RepID=A0A410D6K9_9BACL|nr:methyl-accepting chemotaxis protein [Sporolactobacillus terrae]QAA21722.1 methyl-accepting chemotaxis protein [Sporolactobacillus terrae]QAA24694.1 methyl-accepting chemotaxis protein [Sporolactobacillus terrae]UAK16528.1 methyl-accepting chemotaxis protein [Sporolactobacillus terrae]BBN97990.1 methyl-accepting chemotaxis protein McpB [Sporolactobacillus terrae]